MGLDLTSEKVFRDIAVFSLATDQLKKKVSILKYFHSFCFIRSIYNYRLISILSDNRSSIVCTTIS